MKYFECMWIPTRYTDCQEQQQP